MTSWYSERDPPGSVQVWFEAGGSQYIPRPTELSPNADRMDLVVEPAGALAGVAKRTDGKPPVNLTVWLQAEPGYAVRLSGGAIRVSADGTFRTPAVMLAGRRYRVVVQGDNVRPFASPWIDPAGEGKTAMLGAVVVETLRLGTAMTRDRPISTHIVLTARDGMSVRVDGVESAVCRASVRVPSTNRPDTVRVSLEFDTDPLAGVLKAETPVALP